MKHMIHRTLEKLSKPSNQSLKFLDDVSSIKLFRIVIKTTQEFQLSGGSFPAVIHPQLQVQKLSVSCGENVRIEFSADQHEVLRIDQIVEMLDHKGHGGGLGGRLAPTHRL